ncbi:MAG: hypothetical protein IJT27_08105 [Clostridia bacterium]|nr:hypothetical protein [Clostridia bacterium]
MTETAEKRRFDEKLSLLMGKKSVVFALSAIIAIIVWMLVSMNQTNEIERTFVNVRVQLNVEGSLPANNNLTMYGNDDFYVDVSVRGKSYLVNASSFADRISVTAALNSVTTPGTYSLPISATIEGYSANDASIVGISKSSISVYFDEASEMTYDLTAEIVTGESYELPENFKRGEAVLSTGSVTLTGPAMQMNRISSVKAVAAIDDTLSNSETLLAEIVPMGTVDGASFEYVTVKDNAQIYVTIPVTRLSTYKPVVSFLNMPKYYRENGLDYSVSPQEIGAYVPADDSVLVKAEELSVCEIDFSRLRNEENRIEIAAQDALYELEEGINGITVTVDFSDLDSSVADVAVSQENAGLPSNSKIAETTLRNVQVIGPAEELQNLEDAEIYALPVLDGITLKSGSNTVPVKFVFRTLTDCWVFGTYSVEILVE